MNEAETRAEWIDPALKAAGWGVVEGSRIAREMPIGRGRLQGAGRRTKPEIADYVLIHRERRLAVVEAKRRDKEVTEGLAQAKRYASKIGAPFAFSTNGKGIYRADLRDGDEGDVESYPTPEELWASTFGEERDSAQRWRMRFTNVPFENRGGQWELRYYQHNAITAAMDGIAAGKNRLLLTLATGTGKTAIAFQIAWKLFHSRWNLKERAEGAEPKRRPRILFLTDRNILANQAFNAFNAFPEDALVRIDPESIRKKGRMPKNGNVFFTIFQTFMTGAEADGASQPNFGDYPSNFFDCIVIDECHRGGAADESSWRMILEYFRPAVQIGLTATPKREANADTYRYFGEPVYVYSLKEGINDGFLTPFKVKQVETDLDEYQYTSDDTVVEGEIDSDKRYGERDFNREIEIQEREKKRVEIFLKEIDQNQKTLVFCADQRHALIVRDCINQLKRSKDPDYCVRVTADDGAEGERFLRTFQDNDKTIPTVLTTSRKLSTGVDARNVRNIVLMRPVNSMIEFKQIIGRGTRLYEGKDYFTIYDFVKAYEHFNDPEWDGEPEGPVPPVDGPGGPGGYDRPRPPPEGPEEPPPPRPPRKRIKVKLADGKERSIRHTLTTSFWGPDGKPMSSKEFVERLFGVFGDLPSFFADEAGLREIWSRPETRGRLLEALAEKGYGKEQLRELSRIVDAEDSDLYDVLAYVAFTRDPLTREERVASHKRTIFEGYGDLEREFIDFVLNQYVREGVGELEADKLTPLLTLKYDTVEDAVERLGEVTSIRELFVGFQKGLYAEERKSA